MVSTGRSSYYIATQSKFNPKQKFTITGARWISLGLMSLVIAWGIAGFLGHQYATNDEFPIFFGYDPFIVPVFMFFAGPKCVRYILIRILPRLKFRYKTSIDVYDDEIIINNKSFPLKDSILSFNLAPEPYESKSYYNSNNGRTEDLVPHWRRNLHYLVICINNIPVHTAFLPLYTSDEITTNKRQLQEICQYVKMKNNLAGNENKPAHDSVQSALDILEAHQKDGR